jgi:hypothetical protein
VHEFDIDLADADRHVHEALALHVAGREFNLSIGTETLIGAVVRSPLGRTTLHRCQWALRWFPADTSN